MLGARILCILNNACQAEPPVPVLALPPIVAHAWSSQLEAMQLLVAQKYQALSGTQTRHHIIRAHCMVTAMPPDKLQVLTAQPLAMTMSATPTLRTRSPRLSESLAPSLSSRVQGQSQAPRGQAPSGWRPSVLCRLHSRQLVEASRQVQLLHAFGSTCLFVCVHWLAQGKSSCVASAPGANCMRARDHIACCTYCAGAHGAGNCRLGDRLLLQRS
jgi:hypothetical protein